MSTAGSQKLDSEKLLRLKYYKDLKNKGRMGSDTFLKPPDTYYIDANLFMVIQPSLDQKDSPKKAKSWVTILSVWNSMIGSNIVSIPWSTSKAGIIPAISKEFF
jgi:sodium-coupled neutral amino acid transporter 9